MIDSRSNAFCLANYYFFRGLQIFFNPSWTVGVPGDPKEKKFRVNQKCYVILFPLLFLTNSKFFYAYPITWMIYYSTRVHQSLFEYPTLSMKYYCYRVQIGTLGSAYSSLFLSRFLSKSLSKSRPPTVMSGLSKKRFNLVTLKFSRSISTLTIIYGLTSSSTKG